MVIDSFKLLRQADSYSLVTSFHLKNTWTSPALKLIVLALMRLLEQPGSSWHWWNPELVEICWLSTGVTGDGLSLTSHLVIGFAWHRATEPFWPITSVEHLGHLNSCWGESFYYWMHMLLDLINPYLPTLILMQNNRKSGGIRRPHSSSHPHCCKLLTSVALCVFHMSSSNADIN